jgi:hypothetical protein
MQRKHSVELDSFLEVFSVVVVDQRFLNQELQNVDILFSGVFHKKWKDIHTGCLSKTQHIQDYLPK